MNRIDRIPFGFSRAFTTAPHGALFGGEILNVAFLAYSKRFNERAHLPPGAVNRRLD